MQHEEERASFKQLLPAEKYAEWVQHHEQKQEAMKHKDDSRARQSKMAADAVLAKEILDGASLLNEELVREIMKKARAARIERKKAFIEVQGHVSIQVVQGG